MTSDTKARAHTHTHAHKIIHILSHLSILVPMLNMHNTHARNISNKDKFVRGLFCVFISASNVPIHSYAMQHKRLAKHNENRHTHRTYTLTNCIGHNHSVRKEMPIALSLKCVNMFGAELVKPLRENATQMLSHICTHSFPLRQCFVEN